MVEADLGNNLESIGRPTSGCLPYARIFGVHEGRTRVGQG